MDWNRNSKDIDMKLISIWLAEYKVGIEIILPYLKMQRITYIVKYKNIHK
jgi:hypothetical protein